MTEPLFDALNHRADLERDLLGGFGSGVKVGDLYDAMVGNWRTELLDAQQSARSLGALSLAIQPRIEFPDFGRQIAEAIGEYQVGIGQGLAEQLAASIKPIALAATSSLVSAFQDASEEERAAEEAMWKMGWWMPQTVSMRFFMRVGRLALAGKRVDVRKAMVGLARSRDLSQVVDGWLEIEPFRARRRFLLDGLKDHRRRRFRVSIPTMLPLIEGIAVDAFTPGAIHGPKPAFEAAALVDAATGPALADTVTALYARHDFSAVASGSRQLNRHLILHGRSTGYGTEDNSVKVLLAGQRLRARAGRLALRPSRHLTADPDPRSRRQRTGSGQHTQLSGRRRVEVPHG